MNTALATVDGSVNVVWAPQPGSQTVFLSCPIFEALYDGTRGPGKSDALLMDFAQFVGRGFGAAWRGILFRQTYPQLADVIAKSKKWFHRIFPRARWIGAPGYRWVFPEGEELLFRHMAKPDDYWNYHGHEYPWIGFEELSNWPNLDCYDAMKACSRSSHPGMPRRYRANANPYGRGHNAVKGRFVDPAPSGVVMTDDEGNQRVRIHGHWSENLALLAADPDYPKKLAADTNPNRRKAWLLGDWDIQAGGMFDDVWNARVHVMPEFKIPPGWRVDRVLDWGSSKPYCTLWLARSNGEDATMMDGRVRSFVRGSAFVVAEDYGWSGQENKGCGLVPRQIAKRNLTVQHAVGQRLGFHGRVQAGPGDLPEAPDGNSPRDEMAQEGMRWLPVVKGKGSREAGWELIRQMLKAATDAAPESAGLYVFETCRHLIRTLPTLPRDEKKPDDVDTDAEDHAADALRYGLLHQRSSGGIARLTGY